MIEAVAEAPARPEVEESHEGAWAIAWRQFKKKKLAVLALWGIGFLFLVAVFAPLLANEMPLYVKAALPARYESAFWAYDDSQRILAGVLAAPAERRDEAKVAQVSENMLGRLADAAELLADEQAAAVRKTAKLYRAELGGYRHGGPFDPKLWGGLRADLEPVSPDGEPKLVARAFFPILRSLDRTELFFIFVFFTVVAFPLISRAIDRYGRVRALDPFNLVFLKAGLLLAIPTVLTAVVPQVFPRREDPHRKSYKKLAAAAAKSGKGDAVFIFPPVPYGENENILEDQKKNPTWLLSREEKVALVLPDLFAEREKLREERAKERFPALMEERTTIAEALDRHNREHMRRNIFARALATLSPPEEVERLRARRGEIEATLAREFASEATALDAEIASRYEKRRDELRWHWLGTDTNGRDVLSRMIYGARVSMSVGFVAEGIAVAIGVVLGALAGFFRGWTDIALSRVIEVVICFPTFFFILTILAFLPQSIINIMVVIGITGWPGIARLMRAEFLRLGGLDFVTAGRALGLSNARIIFRHVLPNGLAPILVSTTFGIAGAILVESALSFLGFGVPQPTASWGDTLNNGSNDPQGTWWLTVFPGTALFLTVTAYNLVGDAFRDATDPRLRQ